MSLLKSFKMIKKSIIFICWFCLSLNVQASEVKIIKKYYYCSIEIANRGKIESFDKILRYKEGTGFTKSFNARDIYSKLHINTYLTDSQKNIYYVYRINNKSHKKAYTIFKFNFDSNTLDKYYAYHFKKDQKIERIYKIDFIEKNLLLKLINESSSDEYSSFSFKKRRWNCKEIQYITYLFKIFALFVIQIMSA